MSERASTGSRRRRAASRNGASANGSRAATSRNGSSAAKASPSAKASKSSDRARGATQREPSSASDPGSALKLAASNLPLSPAGAASLAAKTLSALAGKAQRRVPKADLDERDPDYIRESLPGLWMLASIYFRGEVRGLERIPAEGPVLLVGNHSGGNVTPDTSVFTLAFNTYFGVERRFYQLAHNLVVSMPYLGFLRKYGTVAASPENANKALDTGAVLLVYPGGDYEVHRPSWDGAKVDFNRRKGFIRLALDKGVPLVPVVSVGGQ